MKRIALAILIAASVVAVGTSAASANEGVTGPGQVKDDIISYYTYVETTGSPATEDGVIGSLGGAISGGYLGNTSNSGISPYAPDSGNGVTPPASPGPLVGGCNSAPGASLGYAITGNGPSAVPTNPDAGPGC